MDLLRVTDDEALGAQPQLQTFDHSLCHDCAYVETITSDCVAHLEKLTHKTAESSQKLLWLVELREKVRENGEFLSNLEEEIVVDTTTAISVTASTSDQPVSSGGEGTAAGIVSSSSGLPVTDDTDEDIQGHSDTSTPKDYI